ncbi:MAG: aminotransferase class V-fold PLP-dependent enzyme [Chitinivibrionales bacterium]|nr:aminotransferase class V-fold PLP-dependent enzyme [Chitinivibrionales bacterium]
MPINVFVPKFHTDEILEHMRECLDRGWTGLGFKTIDFENAWKDYTGLPNAHYMCSNTVGLHLALNVLKKKHGWKDGDEVISTPLTFVSTNHAILYEHLKPVFADVDEYLCLDPVDIEEKITERTRAVMFVGMGGNSGRLTEVAELCSQKGLVLVLDAAHMAGTRLNGKHVGSEGEVAIFSFQAVKNLPTGDSGMVCFMDEELDKQARKLSWMGISKDTYQRFNTQKGSYRWRYDVPELGFKYHGNSIMASIGIVQLKYVDEDNAYRRKLAAQYDDLLAEVPQVEIVPTAPNCETSRHLYQICVPQRDEVMQHFYENDIYPGVHYVENTEYPMYAYGAGTCARAAEYASRLISLPLHLRVTTEDVEKVVSVLRSFSFYR